MGATEGSTVSAPEVTSILWRRFMSGQSLQLSLEASAYRIQTDVNCHIAVSDFIT